MPHCKMSKASVIDQRYIDVIALSGVVSSKGEASRLVAGGGAYLNNSKVEDSSLKISEKDLIGGEFLLLGMGKKKKILIRIED